MDNIGPDFIVTFGKYNGKKASDIVKDEEYCNWLYCQNIIENSEMDKLISSLDIINSSLKKSFIYILKLVEDKYYIGKTTNVRMRYKQHVEGNGSEWTRKYIPIRLIKCFEMKNLFDEDNTTKEYMKNHGIDNVRGGSYCQIILSDEIKNFIQRELWSIDNKCHNCGGDHFVNFCPSKNKISENTNDVESLHLKEEQILKIFKELNLTEFPCKQTARKISEQNKQIFKEFPHENSIILDVKKIILDKIQNGENFCSINLLKYEWSDVLHLKKFILRYGYGVNLSEQQMDIIW